MFKNINILSMGLTQSKEEVDLLEKYVNAEELQRSLEELDTSTDDSDNSSDYVIDANDTVIATDLIQENVLLEIEKQLDIDEKISLTYLLYENSWVALKKVKELLLTRSNESTNILSYWYKENNLLSNVNETILEALCILENYEVLKNFLKQNKHELIQRFLPRRKYACIHVNKFRKVLYLICEDLNNRRTKQLVQYVQRDLKESFMQLNENYLEMYFLHWETVNYITKDNVDSLSKAFKYLNMNDCYASLQNLVSIRSNVNNNSSIECAANCDEKYSKTDSNDVKRSVVKERYHIDTKYPGLCLIINQIEFHKEFDPKFKPFPKDFKCLENRKGSDKDADKLQKTFESFSFKVIVMKNVIHVDITKIIEDYAKQASKYSTYFVCILSHGIEGHVYGANSLPVSVNAIYDSMNLAKCEAKVLILQACQGNVCQEVEVNDLQLDGPSTINSAPSYPDVLVFWATVPGYAAIRDPNKGSWFIQILCDKIVESADDYHLQEICTLVENEISRKYWNKDNKKLGAVPIVHSTFKKFLYFPSKRN